MPELKILIIGINYAPEVSGIAPYTTGLARGLAAAGHRVQVMCGFPHYPAWRFASGYEKGWRRREADGDVEVIRLRHPLPTNAVGPTRVLMEAVFTAQAGVGAMADPDVVLVMSPALLSVGAALARRARSRAAVGVIVQDLYSRAFPETGALGGHGTSWVRRLERHLLGRANGIAVIHDKFRDTVASLGVARDRVTVIRNWSHVGVPSDDVAGNRKAFGWSGDDTIVLHAGNMGYKQGLENVVEAARLADDWLAPVRFVLLGDGARRAALEEAGRGIRRLEFLAPLPAGRFEDAMGAADLLLLNEKPEVSDMCVPGKLTSYFAAGRPVIGVTAPDSGAASEINAAEAGILVESGKPARLLDAVLTLRSEPHRCAVLGKSGRAYAESVLTEGAAMAAYLGWVESLVVGRRPRRIGPPRTRTDLRRSDGVDRLSSTAGS